VSSQPARAGIGRGEWPAAPPDGIPTGETALRGLSERTLKAVYFLVGDHAWTQSRLAERIRELAVPEEWRSMNAETVWADEMPEVRVTEMAATPPFGSSRRFVLVRGVEAYRGGASAEGAAPVETDGEAAARAGQEAAAAPARRRRTKASKAEATPLVSYVSVPPPDTVLVLTSEKRDLKWWAGDALFEAAESAGAVVACLPPADLRGWLAERAVGLGTRIEPAAADELVERAGGDSFLLIRELEKLSAYVGVHGVSASAETPKAASAGAITVEHVQALTGETAPPSVFAYLDALFVERQPARALSLLARLLDDSHPLELHAMLLTQLRKLVALKGALAAGLTDWQIVSRIRLPYSLVGSLKMMVGRTRPERFAALLRALAQAERELKRGRDGRAVLEDLTLECCR